ncbi:MAG: phosphatase PAP2 family protein [Acidimicrobiales bacterium]
MDAHPLDRPRVLAAYPVAETWQEDLVARARHDGWVRTSAKILVASYVVLAAAMVGLGLSVSHFGPISRWDNSVVGWFSDHRSSGWNDAAKALSALTDTVTIAAVAVATLLVLAWRRRWVDMLVLGIGLPLELLVLTTATFTVDRPRPDVERLGRLPGTASFPSGHTAAGIVCYGGILVLLSRNRRPVPRAALAAGSLLVALLVAGVGFSRVYQGLHFPTDVMAGAVYGAGCLAVAVLITAICADVRADRDARYRVKGCFR